MTPPKSIFRVQLIVFIGLVFPCLVFSQHKTDFWANLPKGEYNCGFRRTVLLDTSRKNIHSTRPQSRPVILNMWYPTHSGRKTMKHKEYLNFSSKILPKGLQKQFVEYNEEMILAYTFNTTEELDSTQISQLYDNLLNTSTHAIKNAPYPKQ